jgi:glycosyltransferase involved in cell wall biosynthesis
MHVVIDARLLRQTGVGRYIRNLVSNLAQIDRLNRYTLLVHPGEEREITLPANFRFLHCFLPWHSLSEQIIMPVLLNRIKPDVFHVPYINYPVFYRGKTVLTIHDLTILNFKTGRASTRNFLVYEIKHLFYRIILGRAVKLAKVIITVSRHVSFLLEENYPGLKNKLKVIYEGIDPAFIDQAPAGPRPIKEPYFLYVGNAYPHKNLETLVEAYGMFLKDNPDHFLVLIGPEDYFYRRLRNGLPNQIKNRIIFPGFLVDLELKRYYQYARAAVFPSFEEGFSLPLLEALKLKTQVICSDIPVFRETVGEYATFFKPQDPIELASKMASVKSVKLNSPGEEFFQKYSWRKLAFETLKAYEAIVKEKV